jgi:branched-subunit amino acid aminotransferase/4-amino-4-deoxychorismate lyase
MRPLMLSMLASCARAARAMSTTQQPFVSAIESIAKPTAQTAKAWLQASPSGAYTTARTHNNKVFEWSAHVQRTADSIRQMAPVGDAVDLVDPAKLRHRLDGAAGAVVDAYRATHGGEELKLTFLVSWDDHGAATVAAHASPLPPLPSKPVRVETRGAPRANAAAKDSAWVSARAPLEALQSKAHAPINELLLSDEGKILEGSQTNFYAIVDGKVVTAGEGILMGTVRRLALEVCERERIPVVLEAPDLKDIERWEGCGNQLMRRVHPTILH